VLFLKTVKERAIAFIILFSMILIMVPWKTEAKGYTNNIDVGLAGMEISVEGKKNINYQRTLYI
jgi:hypothetical protein